MNPDKYTKITSCEFIDDEFRVTVKIKWWGWVFIVAETMKESTDLPWWKWLAYPYFVIIAIRGFEK